MSLCDVIIIGAGHNGLTCAAYLAHAGLSVLVVEARHIVGGAAVTEEFHPGFRNSVASYTVGLLNPKIIRDLDLHAHGLRIVERGAMNFLPGADGNYLLTRAGHMQEDIARISAKDAQAYPAYAAEIDRAGDILHGLLLRTPPNLPHGGRLGWLRETIHALALGRSMRGLDRAGFIALHDLMTRAAGDYLDRWFEHDLVKALFGFDAVVGNFASPYTPGSAYVQLHHTFGEVNGKRGVWGHAIGGMGAITQAMAKSAAAAGAKISTQSPVREVIVEKGRACGIVLENGTALRARASLYETRAGRCIGCRFSVAHSCVAHAIGDIPDECRTQPIAQFFSSAGIGPRASSQRWNHSGALACLYGSCLLRGAPARLEPCAHC
jgi:phytoene dehydrogenase-like protein